MQHVEVRALFGSRAAAVLAEDRQQQRQPPTKIRSITTRKFPAFSAAKRVAKSKPLIFEFHCRGAARACRYVEFCSVAISGPVGPLPAIAIRIRVSACMFFSS
jgi:hypothetical protein